MTPPPPNPAYTDRAPTRGTSGVKAIVVFRQTALRRTQSSHLVERHRVGRSVGRSSGDGRYRVETGDSAGGDRPRRAAVFFARTSDGHRRPDSIIFCRGVRFRGRRHPSWSCGTVDRDGRPTTTTTAGASGPGDGEIAVAKILFVVWRDSSDN